MTLERPLPLLKGLKNYKRYMEQYLKVNHLIYPSRGQLYSLQQLCCQSKHVLCALTSAPYYEVFSHLGRSKLYQRLEELLLASSFKGYFLKGEPKYNIQVLATLSYEASYDMEAVLLKVQTETNTLLKAKSQLLKRQKQQLEQEQLIQQAEQLGLRYCGKEKQLNKLEQFHKDLITIRKSKGDLDLSNYVDKSPGKCVFEFTQIDYAEPFLYVKVTFFREFIVSPTEALIASQVPRTPQIEAALQQEMLREPLSNYVFRFQIYPRVFESPHMQVNVEYDSQQLTDQKAYVKKGMYDFAQIQHGIFRQPPQQYVPLALDSKFASLLKSPITLPQQVRSQSYLQEGQYLSQQQQSIAPQVLSTISTNLNQPEYHIGIFNQPNFILSTIQNPFLNFTQSLQTHGTQDQFRCGGGLCPESLSNSGFAQQNVESILGKRTTQEIANQEVQNFRVESSRKKKRKNRHCISNACHGKVIGGNNWKRHWKHHSIRKQPQEGKDFIICENSRKLCSAFHIFEKSIDEDGPQTIYRVASHAFENHNEFENFQQLKILENTVSSYNEAPQFSRQKLQHSASIRIGSELPDKLKELDQQARTQ